jgi:hypothetical protein
VDEGAKYTLEGRFIEMRSVVNSKIRVIKFRRMWMGLRRCVER